VIPIFFRKEVECLRRKASSAKSGRASYTAFTYLALFGFVTTVPLLVLLGALLFQSAFVQRAELEARVEQSLDALVNGIDRDLDRDITILQTLATSQALAGAEWPTFYNQAKAALQGRAYLVLADAAGRQIVNTYVPYGQQPAMTGDPETIRRVLQTKAAVVSNLFVSLVVKKPVFNVSIPVLQDGQVRYVMSLGLLPNDLEMLLASEKPASEWVSLIWDANGVILARLRDNDRFVGTKLPENMRERGQRAVVRTTNLNGVDVLHATAVSQISGWGVGVNVPYSVIVAQVKESLLLWIAASISAVAIALALGWFFARQITTSLSVGAKAAIAFGRGDSFAISGSSLKEADAFLRTLREAQDEQLKAQSHQKLLLRELQHRTQNLFAVIQVIITRSFAEGKTMAEVERVISGRVQALARTHAILAGADWEGALLSEILSREVGDEFSTSVAVTGCNILLSADAAQQFALIIHELATNALKYGALSVAGGTVTAVGNVVHAAGAAEFSLLWTEHGGPLVAQPTRKGFGSVILFDTPKTFGMQVSASYDPDGLSYALSVPMHIVAPSNCADIVASAEAQREVSDANEESLLLISATTAG
jgi:two-component sensor histidine kinase